MYEVLRILLNRKTVILMIIITLLNFILFSLSCDENKNITLQGDELKHYVEYVYPEFLINTSDQAETLNILEFSGKDGGFVKRNIAKSNADFMGLSGVTPIYGENRGIVVLSNYHLTDIVFVGMLLILVFGFNEESKKGLTLLIRATVNGRMKLAVYRVTALLIGAAVFSALLYGGNVVAAYLSFGDVVFFRPIQSVPEFMRCPFNISIGQYLIFQTMIKCVSGLAVAVLLYLFMSIFNTIITAIGFTVLMVSSFILYSITRPTSYLNNIKFANIIALLKTDDFFKEYCNLNIFGTPVGILPVSFIFVCTLLIIASIFAIIINGHIYNKPAAVPLHYISDKISTFFSMKIIQLPLFLWEGLKILIRQKGVIFIAVCFGLALSSALSYQYLYPFDKFELEWHDRFDGIITQELLYEMNDENNILSDELEQTTEEMEKYLLDGGSVYTLYYARLLNSISDLTKKINALARIIETAESGLRYSEDGGRIIWLIKPYSYKLLLEDDIKTVQRNNLYILLGIIGALAGIMSYERQSGMIPALRSTYKGRFNLTATKIIWVFVITVIFALAVYFIQFFQIKSIMEYSNLSAPLQSLSFMRNFPFYISIRFYIILLYAARACIAFACGIFVSAVSAKRNDTISVIGICVLFMVTPYVLLFM